MENQNKLVAVALTVGVMTFAGLWLFQPKVVTQTIREVPSFAGVSSPDLNSPYFSYGSNRYWGSSASINATQALCDLVAPAGTSTLEDFSFAVQNPYPFAAQVTMGFSATSSAIVTPIASVSVPASKNITLVATSGIAQSFGGSALELGVVMGGSHFSVTMASTTPSPLFAGAGTCKAVWKEVN